MEISYKERKNCNPPTARIIFTVVEYFDCFYYLECYNFPLVVETLVTKYINAHLHIRAQPRFKKDFFVKLTLLFDFQKYTHLDENDPIF